MAIPRRLNIFAALRDLRQFLGARQKHEVIFAFLAIAVTSFFVIGFYLDSNLKRPWKRDIQYVESWPLDRSDAEIIAKQKVDLDKRKIAEAKLEALRKQRRGEFKKVDDALNRWGI